MTHLGQEFDLMTATTLPLKIIQFTTLRGGLHQPQVPLYMQRLLLPRKLIMEQI